MCNPEEATQMLEILSFSQQPHVWWIDDCFTSKQSNDPEHLPFECINDIDLFNSIQDVQSAICLRTIKNACEKFKLGFSICSFEFAEKEWNNLLNKERTFIFLDQAYGKNTHYGTEFYKRYSFRGLQFYPDMSFLTSAAELVRDELIKYLGEARFKSLKLKICAKPTSSLTNDDSSNKISSYLKIFSEEYKTLTFISDLPVEQWIRLRTELEKISSTGNNSPHHLPYGGDLPVSKDKCEEIIELIKESLSNYNFDSCPNYQWSYPNINPPLRALAQFDSVARDLMAAFFLVEHELVEHPKSIEITSSIRKTIHFNIIINNSLVHDYLWFNASLLLKGLTGIYNNLPGAIQSLLEGKNPNTFQQSVSRQKPYEIRVLCIINEKLESDKGLRISFHQYRECQTIAKDEYQEDLPAYWRATIPVPTREEARKKIKEAYSLIERAGGKISVTNGILQIDIEAEIMRGPDGSEMGGAGSNNAIWIVKQPLVSERK